MLPVRHVSLSGLIRRRSFSARLSGGIFILIVLTTLSAGLPAYWLTRRQLETQVWANVSSARQATESLLQAETTRLTNLAILFTERPTLQRMVRAAAWEEFAPYLRDFQAQSDLDVLLFCQHGRLRAGEEALSALCHDDTIAGFVYWEEQPLLVVRHGAADLAIDDVMPVTVVGRWLTPDFLRQLVLNTSAQQSILRPDGQRLASSLEGLTGVVPGFAVSQSAMVGSTRLVHSLMGVPYFAAYAPLSRTDGRITLISEVALPISDLVATEQSALLLLIGSTLFVALVGGLLSVWTVSQLTAPLQKLTRVADQISQGALMMPIPSFTAPEEVSKLATALQHSQASMLEALAERSQARDWLNTLVQSIVEGVVTVDGNGRITFFSQGAETLTGWRSEAAVGQLIDTVLPVLQETDAPFWQPAPPRGRKQQVAIRARTGRNLVLAVTGAQMMSPEPRGTAAPPQVALVLRDVTQEEALRDLRAYFLANISHEFRTPLSTLTASMELLLDETENLSAQEMRQLLRPSHLSLVSLQTLIDNLLESSRIEAGRFVVRIRPCDIHDSLTDALTIVRPLLNRRQQTVSLSARTQLPDMLADPARLTQVLVNLLTNASKYSPLGTQIDLHLEPRQDMLYVAVWDQGPGIPALEQENLFRRFVRLDMDDREQYGIGLGLYVVKTVVEAHNGRVGVMNRPGGGSIFWFELPTKPAILGEEAVAEA